MNNILAIQKLLKVWFQCNKRNLPWRINRNWYTVLVSETLLQQTRVDQVVPYFHRFINKFPEAAMLAKATEEEVLIIWKGLGYYYRALNLHKTVKIIIDEYGGKIPLEKTELLKLPGIGQYTANALLSLAFNQKFGVVDGNVIRVMARLFGISNDTRLASTRKIIQSQMDDLIDTKSPADFNETIMDFGATQCLPKNPKCKSCPLTKFCFANLHNQVDQLPYKSASLKKQLVKWAALIIRNNNKILICRRPLSGLLPGMWEFPSIKFDGADGSNCDIQEIPLKNFHVKANYIRNLSLIKHTYSHFHLHLHSYLYQASNRYFSSDFYIQHKWVDLESLNDYPIHGAMQKLIRNINSQLKVVPK